MHTVGWNRCSRPASCTPTMNPRGRMPSLWSIVVSPASSTMHRAGLGVFTTPVGRTRLPNPSLPSRGFGKVGYTKEKWYLFPPIYFLLALSLCPSLTLSPPSLLPTSSAHPCFPHPLLFLCLCPMSPALPSPLHLPKLIK